MDECKNRAPGSLEWDEAEGERKRFKQWWNDLPLSYRMTFQTDEFHWVGWQGRQPEIDALKAENEAVRKQIDTMSATCVILNGRVGDMKAENEKLRKAAEEFVQWYDSLEPGNSIHAITLIHNLRAALNKGKS